MVVLSGMNRRAALTLGTTLAVGTGVTAYGLLAATTVARAEGSMNLPNSVQAYTDSGKLKHVAIWGRSEVVWRGFEVEAAFVTIDVNLHITDIEDDTPVYSSTIHSAGPLDLNRKNWGDDLDQLSGRGKRGRIQWTWGLDDELERDPSTDWHVIGTDPNGHGAPSNPAPANVVYVPEDHDIKRYRVAIEFVYRWYDADPDKDGDEIYAEAFRDAFRLDVHNVIAHAEGGSGIQGGVEAVADNSTATNASS